MKIEKVERSKHKQGRVLVYLEGGDLLRVTEDELLHFDLCAGLDISPETVVELKKRAAGSQTRERAVNMISARALSRSELKRRLRDKGAQEEDAEAAAAWLEDIGALDDLSYAKCVVRHYCARGYGAAKLRDELRRRGVPRALWDEALAEAPEASQTILKVVEAKTKGKPMDEKARKKLCDMLARRGFSWGDIRAALAQCGTEFEED